MISSVALSCAEPSKRALGERVSPISVIAVTDLPEPDSPTIATISPGVDVERDAVDGLDDAVLGGERDLAGRATLEQRRLALT